MFSLGWSWSSERSGTLGLGTKAPRFSGTDDGGSFKPLEGRCLQRPSPNCPNSRGRCKQRPCRIGDEPGFSAESNIQDPGFRCAPLWATAPSACQKFVTGGGRVRSPSGPSTLVDL